MKNLTPSFSLPKITSRFIEDLIKQNSQSPPIINTQMKRMTYNKIKQNLQEQRFNRHTQADYRLGGNQFSKNKSIEILKVSSPFYRKINPKNVKSHKCQCHQVHENQSLYSPTVMSSCCPYHQQIITKKTTQTKKYHQSVVNLVKQDHIKIHQKIDQIQTNYLSYSLENSERIRAQKYINSKKNAQEFQSKLEKIKFEDKAQKQLNKILLKNKLEQIYNLDNQNLPYEKIMEMRNKWYRQKKVWAIKILNAIHSELKQLRVLKQKNFGSNKKGQLVQISQNENILLDLEKCLAVILNNVQSIDELLIKNKNIEKVTTKIEEIFKKNLQITEKSYGKKLCRKLDQIVQKFYVYSNQEPQAQKNQYNEEFTLENSNIDNEQNDKKISRIIEDLNSYSYSSTPANITSKIFHKGSQNQVNGESKDEIHNKRSPKISGISVRSIETKISESSNKQNALDSKNKLTKKVSLNDQKQNLVEKVNTSRSIKSQKSNKSKFSSKNIKQSVKEIPQSSQRLKSQINKSLKTTPHVTPSWSRRVIDQLDEFMLAQDNEQVDADYEDQYAKQKALKFIQATKLAKQKYQKEQAQRIAYVIDYVKARIKIRQANKVIIPKKYQNIQYQKFCIQNTFRYITSMIDEFQGNKKFTLLYGQLRLKKNILDDQYIQEVVETFKQMFQKPQQFQQWKDYLFQQRNKMIFEKLNRMIDLGMKEISKFQFQQHSFLKNDTDEHLESQQIGIFNKVDQSQIAYQHYLQKIQRNKDNKINEIHMIQRDLNIRNKQKSIKKQANQDQLITQKTINSHIQSNSTKSIRYTFIQNQKSINYLKKGVNNLKKSQVIKIQDDQNKKKVLKYMLKKKPQQFQILNKDVNQFSKYVKDNFPQGKPFP